METAVHALIGTTVVFALMAIMFDMTRLRDVKRDIYEASRAAGQDSLLELRQAISSGKVLTSAQMLQHWLVDYALQSSGHIDGVKVTFLALGTEPQYYLVTIQGTDKYRFVTGLAQSEFTSGAMIVTDDSEAG